MQKDKLNIKDIIEKLKDIEYKSHKSDVPTSIYDNLLLYLESQNLRQNIIKDDSNNVFRAFSDAMNKGQLTFKPIKEKLVEKLHESHNQLKHILKLYHEIDPEDYLDRLDIASVDPMIELGFLLQLYNKNLRLFYFYEDSSLMEIKLPASSSDAEYITLFYFKSMFHTIKELKKKTEETKINLANFGKEYKPEEDTKPFDKFHSSSSMAMPKSKSSVFPANFEIGELADKPQPRNPEDRKANYKKKGMSSTSGSFVPPQKEKKPLSPPPGFDPLPNKPASIPKPGYSSMVYPNQNMLVANSTFSGGINLAPKLMSTMIGRDKSSLDPQMASMGMRDSRQFNDDNQSSYMMSGPSKLNSMPIMSSSQMNRLPSGSLLQSSMPPPFPGSGVMGSKISADKFPVMSSYMMPMQKDEAFSSSKENEQVGEFYKQYMDNLHDPAGKKQTGVLKFFNDGKGFGFLVSDADGKDIFFHYDDVKDIKLSKEFLKEAKNKYITKFAFELQVYYGKYNISSKAVNLELLGMFDQKFLLNSS